MHTTKDFNSTGLAKPIVIGWLLVAGFVVTCAILGDYRQHLRVFQLAWVAGAVGFGLIARSLFRGDTARSGSWSLWMVGIVAIRLALLHTVPSDDLHRYVWEGKIQRYGANPYTTIPASTNDPLLIREDPNWPKINHPDYPAIYPPLSQLVFRLTSAFSNSVYIVKGFLVFIELLAIAVVGRLLLLLNRSPHWAALYALCPLTITSFAIDGHQDTLMLLALAGASICGHCQHFWKCGALIGVAISAKTVAIVLLPWLMFRRPIAVLAAIAVVVGCYLPYSDAGWHVFDSLLRFGGSTSSLGALVTLTEPILGDRRARMFAALVVAVFAIYISAKRLDLPRYATRIFAVLFLALPVVHAWYLTWSLFFAWSRVRVAWLMLCVTAAVYFEAESHRSQTGEWIMPTWVFAAWYGPFALALIVEYVWRKRARDRNQPYLGSDSG
ncbi:MAG: hypothetical protein R3E58_10355 [Phycisphaerae bacterium]|nr:DUF2029 domain-containing protein [Phycisphaerales bacterium]